ncbi:MAG TPA: HAD family hydrolase [Candidatus Limnocylindria bacterium]|jgi:putative hydrolase of the HAD superfamily
MPIRAILFDLDNTLLLEDEATLRALEQTSAHAARRAGVDGGVIQVAAGETAEALFRSSEVFAYADALGIWWGEALWGEFAGDQPGLAALRRYVPGFRRAVWSGGLEAAGITDGALADELVAVYRTARRALCPIDPEAEATLDDVGRDHRLALVTNGAPDVQREKLAATTLASRFAAIVISGEVGAGKPDPLIFRAALDALDVERTEAVMVGDSLERDVVGARRAGLRSIWLDRTNGGAAGTIVPDARIRALHELRAAVGGLERVDAFPQPA